VAVTLLVLFLAGLAGVGLLAGRIYLANLVPLPKPPEVLVADARAILEDLGYTHPQIDTAYGFNPSSSWERWVLTSDRSPRRWDHARTIRPAPISFWYRESPRYLVPLDYAGTLSAGNPPLAVSGMTAVRLDPDGRLIGLAVVPPEHDDTVGVTPAVDWNRLLDHAGLSMDDLRPVSPSWNPLVDCDERIAWEGAYPGQPDVPIRAEAGAYGGRPVYFRIVAPWTVAPRMGADTLPAGERVAYAILLAVLLAVLVGAFLLARRNRRLGRGDTRGASRLSAYLLSVFLGAWLIAEHHVPTIDEFGLFFSALPDFLLAAVVLWVLYVALEPFVRRIWPDTLISWSRLLSGRIRDPLVGRDVLIGAVVGVVVALIIGLNVEIATWLGVPPPPPSRESLDTLTNTRYALALTISMQFNGMFIAMASLFVIAFFRKLTGNAWVAAGAIFVLFTGANVLADPSNAALTVLNGAVVFLPMLLLLLRAGLLATISMITVSYTVLHFPFTLDSSSWFFSRSLLIMGILVAVAGYAFYLSLAGRPLVRDPLLND
jgi:hypothetical protein